MPSALLAVSKTVFFADILYLLLGFTPAYFADCSNRSLQTSTRLSTDLLYNFLTSSKSICVILCDL